MISALLFTVEEFEDSSFSRTFLYGGLLKENSVGINSKSSQREVTSGQSSPVACGGTHVVKCVPRWSEKEQGGGR